MPQLEGYEYLGCSRCGELELAETLHDSRYCQTCAFENELSLMINSKQLRQRAMSKFREGQPMQGRAFKALAEAIDQANLARQKIYQILEYKETSK